MPDRSNPSGRSARDKPLRSAKHRIFCQLLKEARKSAGLSQAELAERIGWRQGDISKVEIGERRLDVVEFLDFAEGLGIDPAKLVKKLATSSRKTKA